MLVGNEYYGGACVCTSLAGGGGGGGGVGDREQLPPNNAFSEFCRYTFGNFSVHVRRQACHLYRQNIDRNSSFRMWKYDNFLRLLTPHACIYIYIYLSMLVFCQCSIHVYSAISRVKGKCIDCMYPTVIWDLKICFWDKVYLMYQ